MRVRADDAGRGGRGLPSGIPPAAEFLSSAGASGAVGFTRDAPRSPAAGRGAALRVRANGAGRGGAWPECLRKALIRSAAGCCVVLPGVRRPAGVSGGRDLREVQAFPLRTDCHTMVSGAYHRIGRRAFELRTGLHCLALAARLYAKWRDGIRDPTRSGVYDYPRSTKDLL